MSTASPAASPLGSHPGVEILTEDRVRDQVSAAEELLFLGHREPAFVAAGVAAEGALRLSAAGLAGPTASPAALLEALLAMRAITDFEYDLLLEALKVRDALVRGYAPADPTAIDHDRVAHVVAITIRLLEYVHATS
jgi:uncharacterized protein YutE (UPF0331/DUF86 family)